ncbi:MAG TPA: tyrosine/phenylalanine carboxypeptidase domain-containing protein, partial [Longimicrobiales bacterium]|nr:tyrosine/phenylalanine carboxypeptidase domain-containing protein [Longimicrobiales bacterium]
MKSTAVDDSATARILRAFRTDAHVRERLPDGDVLNIDRKLPYLFLYRQPPSRPDPGTDRLVLAEASYLIARGDDDAIQPIVHALAEAGTAELGSFLLFELWSGADDESDFVIHAPAAPAAASVDTLCKALEKVCADLNLDAAVSVRVTDERHPPDRDAILSARDCWEIGCLSLGLQVPPLFRDADTGDVYPVFLRRLRSALSVALRQSVYEFARVQTSTTVESYRALGPRRFDDAVTSADAELAGIERSYSLLLLVSPINSGDAWQRFRDDGYDTPPDFRYRLLPVDPDVLKRRLFALDLDPIADPALAFLFHDKRSELDRQITLIAERNTAGFRYTSMRLYGDVDDMLLRVACDILEHVQPTRWSDEDELVDAAAFAAAARTELAHYRTVMPGLAADVQVRSDLTGLMVSQGNLLISEEIALRPARVQALLHHEVGTHVLTYYNGRAQPLQQLSTGLADYDELQEGLAVFAEYGVGGLSASRMRVLAARVLAAHSMEHGAEFIETFRLLTREHGFARGTAFDITERVHQCGGFNRDMIYLRGLLRLVEHLRAGGALEPLYVGKIAAKHIEIIDELLSRGVLVPP